MNIFGLRDHLVEDYSSYVSSFIRIKDPRIEDYVRQALDEGALWPDPLIQLNPSFEPGKTIDGLVEEGVLTGECANVFRVNKDSGGSREPLRIHRHQEEAIRTAREGHNYVLTTGTGSGKSLSYVVPAVDRVLRRGSGRGIQAIVVYPMNALANSQHGELEKFLSQGYAITLRPDFTKLGSEGRSTATTILSLSAVTGLRGSDLPEEARKLLSFTDNRQDASLQAGHFNDFVEVAVLRSALYRAALEAGEEGLSHEVLTERASDALNLPLEECASASSRPDFSYGDGYNAVIYIDGPHHGYPHRRERDAQKTEAMEDLGYMVIRFGYGDDWEEIVS